MRRLTILMLALPAFTWGDARVWTGSDDPEAAVLFSRMAEKVAGAKTVRLVTRGSFKTAGFEAEVNATLLLKEGNRMSLKVDTAGLRDGSPHHYALRLLSDGQTLRMREDQGTWSSFATTSDWNRSVAVNVARGGFPSGLELLRVKKRGEGDPSGIAFRPVSPPTDFVLWSKERLDTKTVIPIEFKVKNDSEFTREASTILWLSDATGLPSKRLTVIRTDRTLTVTESYTTFALNDTVEDSEFAVPKGDF